MCEDCPHDLSVISTTKNMNKVLKGDTFTKLLYQISGLVVLELQQYLSNRNYNVYNGFVLILSICNFCKNVFPYQFGDHAQYRTSINVC